MPFDHEKMDVYRLSVDFVVQANEIVEKLPKGRRYIADQLQRAALSVVLNIAEGAGKFAPRDKASFYTIARGSATECAAVLDVCQRLQIVEETTYSRNKSYLDRIAQMLTKLIKAQHNNRTQVRTRVRTRNLS
jgi:four helix bundle protein